jgi:hypothetical protein
VTIFIIPIDHNDDSMVRRKPGGISAKARLKLVEQICFPLEWVDLERRSSDQQAVQEFA